MARIFLVHGTNAYWMKRGPSTSGGGQWWQEDGVFEHCLRQLIDRPSDGTLAIEAHAWDGKNSETSRWNAGKRLAARLLEVDAAGEPYCIIGHSHGGSVTAHALMLPCRGQEEPC